MEGWGPVAPWLRYTIAFVVFCHGFIYVRIGAVLPGPITQWRGRSWLLGGLVAGDRLRLLAVALHVVAGVLTIACSVAIAFAASLAGWWPPSAIAGAIVGLLAFAVFFDGQWRLFAEEGGIGAVVSLLLLIAALAFPRAFG
jgi:hypothetical protein